MGESIAPRAEMASVMADSLTAANGLRRSEVAVRRSQIDAGSDFMIDMPKHSDTVITLKAIEK